MPIYSIGFLLLALLARSSCINDRADKMIGTIVLSGLLALASAQFPPTPEGLTILRSKFNENVTISFKEVRGSTFS